MDEDSMDSVPDNTFREEVKPVDIGIEQPEEILLTADGRKFLNQTRPWVRFMAIIVFIGAAVSLLVGLMSFLFEVTGSLFGAQDEVFGGLRGGGFILGLVYFVLAILYIPPGIFLTRYASAIRTLESTGTSKALENALKYQKSFWRYIGMLTVVSLIVAAAVIAFSFAIALFMVVNR